MENQKETFSTAISLKKRAELSISGVTDIISSDENIICLNTTDGLLIIDGIGLRIISMNISGGDISVLGKIDSLTYSERNQKRKKCYTRHRLRCS